MVTLDKSLSCRDCGQQFLFTTGEQEYFASRGFTNEPSRCPDCRAARKADRGGGGSRSGGGGYSGGSGYSSSGGYSGGSGYSRAPREMHPAVCARCGKETQVPFVPRGDRPVYCSDCFSRERSVR